MRSGLSESQAGCTTGVLIGEPRQPIKLRQYKMEGDVRVQCEAG